MRIRFRFMLRMIRITIAEWFMGRSAEKFELYFNSSGSNVERKSGDSISVLSQIAREHQMGTGYTSTAATIYGGII